MAFIPYTPNSLRFHGTGVLPFYPPPPVTTLPKVLNRLRRVVRTVVSSHLGEKSPVSYQLNENQYAANEAEDPFAHALVEYLRRVFLFCHLLCYFVFYFYLFIFTLSFLFLLFVFIISLLVSPSSWSDLKKREKKMRRR